MLNGLVQLIERFIGSQKTGSNPTPSHRYRGAAVFVLVEMAFFAVL